MSVNFNDLDPDSPEYEAAVMAAQDEEDRANGNVETDEPAEAAPVEQKAAAVEPGSTPADEAEPAAVEGKEPAVAGGVAVAVAGVASKDGSRVLPYASGVAAAIIENTYNAGRSFEYLGEFMGGEAKFRFKFPNAAGDKEPTDNGVYVIDAIAPKAI